MLCQFNILYIITADIKQLTDGFLIIVLWRVFETVMVSMEVAIETASQMMGHKTIAEDKPYLTHDKDQIAFVAMDFSDVPISSGYYSGHENSTCSRDGDGGL